MEILSIEPLPEGAAVRSRVHSMKVAHATMAALCARGLTDADVARLTNRSPPTIRNFRLSPAGAELIAQLAEGCDEEILSEVDYRLSLRRRAGTIAAERMVDKLEDPTEDIPIRTLLAIAADVDDRTGLGKQSMQVNLNIDVKSRLNAARERRVKVIEARAEGRLLEYVRGEG
jgi:hypothetical protein